MNWPDECFNYYFSCNAFNLLCLKVHKTQLVATTHESLVTFNDLPGSKVHNFNDARLVCIFLPFPSNVRDTSQWKSMKRKQKFSKKNCPKSQRLVISNSYASRITNWQILCSNKSGEVLKIDINPVCFLSFRLFGNHFHKKWQTSFSVINGYTDLRWRQ